MSDNVNNLPQKWLYQGCAHDLQVLAKNAWHPVDYPPNGPQTSPILWLEDIEAICPEQVQVREIGTAYTTGFWAWPRDVVLMPK